MATFANAKIGKRALGVGMAAMGAAIAALSADAARNIIKDNPIGLFATGCVVCLAAAGVSCGAEMFVDGVADVVTGGKKKSD